MRSLDNRGIMVRNNVSEFKFTNVTVKQNPAPPHLKNVQCEQIKKIFLFARVVTGISLRNAPSPPAAI